MREPVSWLMEFFEQHLSCFEASGANVKNIADASRDALSFIRSSGLLPSLIYIMRKGKAGKKYQMDFNIKSKDDAFKFLFYLNIKYIDENLMKVVDQGEIRLDKLAEAVEKFYPLLLKFNVNLTNLVNALWSEGS